MSECVGKGGIVMSALWQNLLGIGALLGLVAVLIVVVGLVAALVAWLERRGSTASRASGAGAMALQQLLQPQSVHMVEAKQK